MSQLLFLRIYKGDSLVAVKQFQANQIIIGKQGDAQIILESDKIAPIHAMIEKRGEDYHLCDLGSESGTSLNGAKILDEVINSGDTIVIDEYRIEFFIGIPKPSDKPIEASSAGDTNKNAKQTKEEVTKIKKPIPEEKTRVFSETSSTSNDAAAVAAKKPASSKQDQVATADTTNAVNVDGKLLEPVKQKRTFAPKSPYGSLDEIIKPSKGSLVEILVAWGDRVLTTYHCTKKGLIRIGSHPKNEIILPTLGSEQSSMPLLKTGGPEAKIIIQPFYKGQVYQGNNKVSLLDLDKSGKLVSAGKVKAYNLFQGEMIRLDMGEGISVYIRYISPTPKPMLIPFLGLTSTELTGLIISLIIGGLIFILSQLEPEKIEEEVQEEIKITKFVFEKSFAPPPPPVQEAPKPKARPTPKPKKVKVKLDEKTKPLVKSVRDKSRSGGAAARARPNQSKSNEKKLTSDKKSKNNNRRVDRGGEKSNKNVNAGTTKRKDIKNTGLLGAFARGGAQSQLAKANQGAGAIAGLSKSVTGEAGSGGDGPVSEGLRDIGKGGDGTAKIGIADIGTRGRGGGSAGYGSGDLGAKQTANIDIVSSDLESDGTIDKEAILRVIRSNRSQILACYERELNKNPNLYGKVKVNWEILSGGRVGKIRIAESTLNNKKVENCITTRFKAWRFPEPPPNQIAELYFPFVLTAK